jgi:hypothetical protein
LTKWATKNHDNFARAKQNGNYFAHYFRLDEFRFQTKKEVGLKINSERN